jgi:hypothetical protein
MSPLSLTSIRSALLKGQRPVAGGREAPSRGGGRALPVVPTGDKVEAARPCKEARG